MLHVIAANGVSLTSLPCGVPLPGEDVVGDDLSSVANTTDPEACYAECMNFPGCIAAVRVDATGGCFLKEVDLFKGEIIEAPGFTSLIRCDFSATEDAVASSPGSTVSTSVSQSGNSVSTRISAVSTSGSTSSSAVSTSGSTSGSTNTTTQTTESSNENCNIALPGLDIVGDVLNTTSGTPDLEACIAACEDTPTCNAAIRIDVDGGCFFKSVDVDTVEITDYVGLTAYLICPE